MTTNKMDLISFSSQKWAGSLILCSLAIAMFFCVEVLSDSRKYRHEILDNFHNYHLYWTLDEQSQSIVFRVEARTRGYVGLGLSPSGGMQGSDIVIGWVKDGFLFLQDYHSQENGMALLDEQQDWEILEGFENDTHTVLVFQRKFLTCDEKDFPISNDTARLIYAYHDEDPISKNFIPYHGKANRGTKSVMLLQPESNQDLPVDVQEWKAQLPNVTIPDHVDTTYWCKVVKAPTLNGKHHVVRISPLVSKESAVFVHHMVLYRCLGATSRELEPHVHHIGHPCYVPSTPETYRKCESVYAAWGIGAREMVMPPQAGLPIGDRASIYFLLEIHYDNANFKSDIIDQSGFSIYYTHQLRRYDAMTLMIGVAVDPCLVVPPGTKRFVVAGHADPLCLGPALPEEGIKVFAAFLHSHLLGRQMKIRHFRNNTELPALASDMNYDFNYQEYRYLRKEVTVLPGDHLVMECSYDSSGRSHTTFGGLGTAEEMCLAFILYYPKIARARALSSPTCSLVKSLAGLEMKPEMSDEDSNYTFYQYFDNNDPWISPSYIDAAEAAMRFGYHRSQCYLGDGIRIHMPKFVTYPKVLQPYEEPDKCPRQRVSEQRWTESSSRSIDFGLTSFVIASFASAYVALSVTRL